MANLGKAGAIARGIQSGIQAGVAGYQLGSAAQERKRVGELDERKMVLEERKANTQEGVFKAKNQYIMATVEQDRILKRLQTLKTQDPQGQNPQILEQAKKLRQHYDLLEQGKTQAFSQIGDAFSPDFWSEYLNQFGVGGAGSQGGPQGSTPSINQPQ